ncbi:MAG TPA: DUF1836 domain-containing protein, partial [Mobilitalea sp.]|nr:DUF1836 domain-containing protein [Mobilitalea sp.]
TKNELLPPPNKKKYSKEHMFLLIFIYYFKNILSISDIQNIFNPLTKRYFREGSDIKLEDIYEEIFRLENEQTEALTKDMIRKMTKAKESFEDVKDEDDHDFLTMYSFISMLCFDVYMRKHMIEQIIDYSLTGEDKRSKKETGKKSEIKPETIKKSSKPTTVKTSTKPTPIKTGSKPTAVKTASKPTPMKTASNQASVKKEDK